jgi:hypothetical protein
MTCRIIFDLGAVLCALSQAAPFYGSDPEDTWAGRKNQAHDRRGEHQQ